MVHDTLFQSPQTLATHLKVSTTLLDHDNKLQIAVFGYVGGSLEAYVLEHYGHFRVEFSHHHTERLPD